MGRGVLRDGWESDFKVSVCKEWIEDEILEWSVFMFGMVVGKVDKKGGVLWVRGFLFSGFLIF